MTSMNRKREIEQRLADLERLQVVLQELSDLTEDLTYEKILDVAGRVTALTAEAKRLIEKHNIRTPNHYDTEFLKMFDGFKEIHAIELTMLNDLNRFLRLEQRKEKRRAQENIVMEGTTCAIEGCKKPARVNEYCKRHAREAGLIVKGKIV